MTDLGFIVKMVIYKCRELGNPVTETLAAYVAQTTLNKSNTPHYNNLRLKSQGHQDFIWKTKSPKKKPKNSSKRL